MNEEQCKELGSSALRKTLKELNLSSLDALGATICVLNVMFEFVNNDELKMKLEKFIEKNETAKASLPIFATILILFEKFEENMSSLTGDR